MRVRVREWKHWVLPPQRAPLPRPAAALDGARERKQAVLPAMGALLEVTPAWALMAVALGRWPTEASLERLVALAGAEVWPVARQAPPCAAMVRVSLPVWRELRARLAPAPLR